MTGLEQFRELVGDGRPALGEGCLLIASHIGGADAVAEGRARLDRLAGVADQLVQRLGEALAVGHHADCGRVGTQQRGPAGFGLHREALAGLAQRLIQAHRAER